MSILVLGTAALDTVKTPSGERYQMLGGSAVHFSMAASLFTRVHLVAAIGRDFPKRHIKFLKEKGIELTSLVVEKGKTFCWEGEYSGDLNTALTLSTQLGVLATFSPKVAGHQRHIENIFLANVDPDIQHYLLSKMHSPRLIGLDSMNYWIDHKKRSLLKILKKVDIFVANDAEARSLCGEKNLIKAAMALRKLGPPMVVIKKGEHGVLVDCGDFIFCQPAYPVSRIIDPTGAGDTFAGGFMGYLASVKKINNKNIRDAITYGTIMASFNVEGFGVACSSKISMKDIKRRLARFRKYTFF